MTLGFIGYQSPLPGCAISAFDIHCGSNKNCRACIQMRRRVLVRADGAGGGAADRNLLHDARACRGAMLSSKWGCLRTTKDDKAAAASGRKVIDMQDVCERGREECRCM